MSWGVYTGWRRGFVDELALPVQWFLPHAEPIRERYPLLRHLVLFRLNGWGERQAACPWLRGLREIELACWFSDDDATAVANSPHLADVERVVLYSGGGLEQARRFVCGRAWPRLRELHLVSQFGAQEEWVQAVNEAAGRPLATVYDFGSELYPFAPDFGGYGFHIGKRQDGTQLFAYGDETEPAAVGWLYHPDGTRREPFRFEFPPELVLPRPTARPATDDWGARWDQKQKLIAARKAFLTERTGFVPAFIRVENTTLDDAHGFCGTGRYRDQVEESWGVEDDPNVATEQDEWPVGHGGIVHDAVRRGEYTFDFGNDWWCDRTGHVTST
jgi:hypothetical protein